MKYCLKTENLVSIGITAEERAIPQRLIFCVEFEHDSGKASQTDHLEDTIDYQEIYDIVKEVSTGGSWNLLETLQVQLTEELTKNIFNLKLARLSIQKFPWEDGHITIG